MNNSIRNDILFFKIWRNVYLKSCIFKHLDIYKQNDYVIIKSRDELIHYKYRNYISKLFIKFDQEIQYNDIPSTPELYDIEFDYQFNQRINFKLPDNILKLTFGGSFAQSLKTEKGNSIFPSNINTIVFGYGFNLKFEKDTIPATVEHISFSKLNQPLEGLLPKSIKTLSLGFSFNRDLKINDIPTSVQSLILSFRFNKPLVLPPNLKKLILGHDFNIPIKPNDLPSTLETLSLGVMFNQPLDGVLPNGLKLLQFSQFYSIPLSQNTIPPSVTKIIFEGYLQYLLPLKSTPNIIPSSVTDISFQFAEEIPLSFAQLISSNDSIFSSVRKLSFKQIGYSFYKSIIPKNTTNLKFDESFNFSLGKDDIPFGIVKLSFAHIDQILVLKPNSIPSTVIHLSIGIVGDQLSKIEKIMSNESIIPSTINKMTVLGFDSNNLKRIVPKSIKELKIVYFRNQIHYQDNIPSTISKIIIKRFNYDSYKDISKL